MVVKATNKSINKKTIFKEINIQKNTIRKYYFLIILSFIIYIENATLPFFAQYDVRPNYLFVEYLEYPKEIFSMIIADYKIELIIAFIY